ncbi:hypothetical protein B7H23_06875 [Notoacmeibacter marinus]|uniref:SpoVT-AbrB domain-containing protein n=1 Tax=Notoacmeibacter marinus TaxID=1876515 RepID=A0A231V390_9HYPH|nr:AbrB/MazE/SpoVT family DNA-binding domain-containing protein [Notoacmeibacter marinus]OXT02607.1 hypothetical protein B7H23_06875 [Notoacmeibacter marinus]
MDYTSRITSKGQTTIPSDIRAKLGVGSGDTIRYVLSGDRAYIVPRNRPASVIFDVLARYAIPDTTIADYRNAAEDEAAERVRVGNSEDSAA